MLGLLAAPATAQQYGDIKITGQEARGHATHGYTEYQFTLVNSSKTAGHKVQLYFPMHTQPGWGQHQLSRVSRTVEVGPGQTVRTSLLQPAVPELGGDFVGVVLDGAEKADPLRMSLNGPRGGGPHGPGGPPGRWMGGPGTPLVLISPAFEEAFQNHVNQQVGGWGQVQFQRWEAREQPPTSATWLGYSRYDGIVMKSDDLDRMEAAARTALWQYVECGGALLVVRPRPLP